MADSAPAASAANTGQLRRELTLFDAVAIGLGAIIGAGIFVVSGVAAGVAGPALLLGLFMAGVAATCNALSSAQLAAAYPVSGGTYEYGYRVLHPWLGFAAGWMFLVSKLAAGGAVALGFAGYLTALVPGLPPIPVALGAVALLTVVNCLGIKKAGRLNNLIVAVTLTSLLALIVVAAPAIDLDNFTPFAPGGWRGVMESAAMLFFAFTGYARLATLGEEVHEPKKTIPRAIVLAVAIASVLYLAVAFVAVGVLGAGPMAASRSPLEQAARATNVPEIGWLIGLGATTAMLGVLLSQLLGISRMIFAMARRRDFPGIFDHVSGRYGVPDRGIILAGAVVALFVVFGTLDAIVSTASFTILLYYGITNVAALRMSQGDKLFSDWIARLGLVFCLVLAISVRPMVMVTGLGVLAAGFVGRFALRRWKARSQQL